MTLRPHRRPFASFSLFRFAALSGLALFLAGPLPGEPRAAVPEGHAAAVPEGPTDAVPAGLSTGDWAEIRGAYVAGRHAVRRVPDPLPGPYLTESLLLGPSENAA